MRARRHLVRIGLAPLLALVLGACTTGVRLGTYDGGVPEPCGEVTCPLGQTCCSPTCGLCVPEGAACIERSCGGPCDPFAAAGTGACRTALGYVWNGNACVLIAGCSCEGVDCGRRYPTLEACQAVHAECVPPTYCITGAECAPDQYCAYPMGVCGAPAGLTGTCVSRGLEATCSAIYSPVCGCDNRTYASGCEAQQSGVSVIYEGECGPVCIPDDARAVGDCPRSLGRAFDGSQCTEIVGCECAGADCERVLTGPCERLHEGCLMAPPDLVCGDQLCYRASEYCILVGTASGPVESRCQPLPVACSPVTCACVEAMGGSCSDDGAEGITIFSP